VTTTLDQEMVGQAVRTATEEVFATMLGLEIRRGDVYIEECAPRPLDGVAALIGLAGSWTGTGSVNCSAEFSCKLCSQFLMTESTVVDMEVLDAVAEIANMIVGNIKNLLEEHLGPMMLSVPTVVYGKNFSTRSLGRNEWIVTPFFCGEERLDVQLCLLPNTDGSNGAKPGFLNAHQVRVQ
jgi:chemotaxis protein CheX